MSEHYDELHAEIENLRRELSGVKELLLSERAGHTEEVSDLKHDIERATAANAALVTELEAERRVCAKLRDALVASEQDAKRYRWVREHSCQYDSAGNDAESWSTHSNPASLDAAIDAAIAAQEKTP